MSKEIRWFKKKTLKSLTLLSLIFLMGALIGITFNTPVAYSQRKPLLVEGKTSIFQRLITHPGAIPHSSPGGPESGSPLISFSPLYVYSMKFEEGNRWYEVGPDTKGSSLFWLNFEYVTLWNNNMTAMFAQKAGRPQSVMFFKNVDYLQKLAMQPGIEGILQNLLQEYDNYQKTKTSPPADFPVLAKEPGDDDGAIPEQKFYLMPILSQDNSLEGLKFLEVVVINPGNPDEMEIKEDTPKNNKRVGIAFVIDTTISMGPYIEASKEICNFIFKMVKDSGHAEDYFLAFIAFRSSLTKTPGLEYTTKL
ncbi:MAG: hypothetical protein LBF22_10055, partial [Deltaproteobacteria bacterium]|nr:hypothetical protein [Deltaproteobacteria bacterium]